MLSLYVVRIVFWTVSQMHWSRWQSIQWDLTSLDGNGPDLHVLIIKLLYHRDSWGLCGACARTCTIELRLLPYCEYPGHRGWEQTERTMLRPCVPHWHKEHDGLSKAVWRLYYFICYLSASHLMVHKTFTEHFHLSQCSYNPVSDLNGVFGCASDLIVSPRVSCWHWHVHHGVSPVMRGCQSVPCI